MFAAHEHAGDVARNHHFHDGAAQHYQDALTVRDISEADRSRLSEKLATTLSFSHDPGSADVWYDHLTIGYLSRPENNGEAINALFRSVRQFWIASKTEATLPLLTQAIHIATLHGDPQLLKKANTLMATSLTLLAHYDKAEQYLHAAGDVTQEDSADFKVLYWKQKAIIAATFGRKKDAFENCDRAIHAIREDSDVYLVTVIWSEYGFVALMLGETEFAKTCYERALLIARRNKVVWLIPQLCLDYGWLLMQMGQYALANEYLVDALAYDAKAAILDEAFAYVGIPLALHMKDNAMLSKCTRPETIDQAFMSAEPARIGLTAAAFAHLYMKRGDRQKAQSLLHRAVTAMHDVGDAWDLPIEIALHGATADIVPARRLLEARTAYPYAKVAEAYLLLFDAFVAQREGRVEEASERACDAVTCFDSLRLVRLADLAQSVFPIKQHRGRSAYTRYEKPFSNLHVKFTEREREIAALVLKGMTSRSIGERLSISPHTVDSHVASIMNRLGIRSRHQLAYVLAEP